MAEDWKRRSDLKSWAISRTCLIAVNRLFLNANACRNGLKTHQTLEGELADQELRRLLVATDLTESDGTRLIAVRLLDTSGGGSALAGGLGGELLARGLATGGLAGGLLGAGHCDD
jgi:hypothetical protein